MPDPPPLYTAPYSKHVVSSELKSTESVMLGGFLNSLKFWFQWTDVFTDAHTSRAVLRGSSRWWPQGSHWYQPKPKQPLYEHNTLLMMSDSMDRSSGIGFRCVKQIA